jgi:AcrR family transcriptional regulator
VTVSAPAGLTAGPAAGLTGTRERILDAALTLFAERGYDATSMRESAEQVGTTKAALYYHFDNKADIVRVMLADTDERVAELVAWARTQPPGAALRRQVLSRWSDIMHAHGLAAFRFVLANRRVVDELSNDRHGGIREGMVELYGLLTPADASVEDQLRTRLALMSVTMAGMAGADIAAEESEILAAARRVALDLLPRGTTPPPTS